MVMHKNADRHARPLDFQHDSDFRPVRTAEQHMQDERTRVRDERIVEWCLTAESEDFAASQKEVNL